MAVPSASLGSRKALGVAKPELYWKLRQEGTRISRRQASIFQYALMVA